MSYRIDANPQKLEELQTLLRDSFKLLVTSTDTFEGELKKLSTGVDDEKYQETLTVANKAKQLADAYHSPASSFDKWITGYIEFIRHI